MENNNNNGPDKNSPGYILGYILGSTFVVCTICAIIGATIKFLLWLF